MLRGGPAVSVQLFQATDAECALFSVRVIETVREAHDTPLFTVGETQHMANFVQRLLRHPFEVQFLILRQAIEHGTESGQSDKSVPTALRKTEYEIQAWNEKV